MQAILSHSNVTTDLGIYTDVSHLTRWKKSKTVVKTKAKERQGKIRIPKNRPLRPERRKRIYHGNSDWL